MARAELCSTLVSCVRRCRALLYFAVSCSLQVPAAAEIETSATESAANVETEQKAVRNTYIHLFDV